MSEEQEVWGWAWADGGVRSLHIRTGNDEDWWRAELEPHKGYERQRFSLRWSPARRGITTLASMAEANSG